MHGWRINLATPNQWQRRERDDVNDELGKPTNITRQPAEYSKVAEKVGEYLGGLGEYCSLYRGHTSPRGSVQKR